MIVKKFIVDDMQEGMLLIRNAMGRDAMILSQRSIRGNGPFGLFKKKRLEVYAAAEEEDIEVSLNQQMQHNQETLNQASRQEQERLDRLTCLIEQMQKQSQMQPEPSQSEKIQPEPSHSQGAQMQPEPSQSAQIADSRMPLLFAGSTKQHESINQLDSDSQNENMEQLLRQIQRAGVQADQTSRQQTERSKNVQPLQPRSHHAQPIQPYSHHETPYSKISGLTSVFKPNPLPEKQELSQKKSLNTTLKTAAQMLQNNEHGQFRQNNLTQSAINTLEAADELNPSTAEIDDPDLDLAAENADEAALLDVMYEKLLAADVHLQVANHFVNQAADASRHYDASSKEFLSDLITDCFSQEGLELKLKKGKQKKVMFAGPAGVGKTSTLIKLAAQLCRDQKLDIGLISTDYQRAAAHLQTEAYANILGLSVYCLRSLSEAPVAKQEMAAKDLILIDTPGCNPVFDEQATLAHQLMEIFTPDQLFVCLAAGTSYSMAGPLLRFFRDLGDFDLLITKMDEIEAYGTLLNFSYLAEKPIACLTDSPFVSEQLRFPDVDAIINRLLR